MGLTERHRPPVVPLIGGTVLQFVRRNRRKSRVPILVGSFFGGSGQPIAVVQVACMFLTVCDTPWTPATNACTGPYHHGPTMIFRAPAMDTAETWFNAQLLKTVRRELGWTQLDLAKHADLSVRVIAKAESGKGVSERTVHTLVRVLREAGKDVTCDDFTGDPRSIVQKFLFNCQMYKKHALSHCRNLIAPDIVIHMDGNPLVNPLAGTYQGIEEFEALLYKYYEIFVCDGGTLGDFTQMRLIGQEVIAWGHQYVRVPEAPPSPPSFTMLRIVFRDGAIARVDSYYEAAGLMSRVETWARLYPEAAWLKYFDVDALRSGPRRRASGNLGGSGLQVRQPAVENEPPTA